MSIKDKMAEEEYELEVRKVKALEKIATSIDALTIWFEEIDKEEWGDRIAWYLSLWKDKYIGEEEDEEGQEDKDE